MVSTTITAPSSNPTLPEVAAKIIKEYPEIFNCDHQKMLFLMDFKLLVRTFVTERSIEEGTMGPWPDFKNIKASRIREIVNRKTTKDYDAKAQANGKPTLLMLAVEDAKGDDQAGIDKEAKDEFMSLGLPPGLMAVIMQDTADRMGKRTNGEI